MVTAGLGLLLYPDIRTVLLNKETDRLISGFEKAYESKETEQPGKSSGQTSGERGDLIKGTDSLRDAVSRYNTYIYENRQADFKDAWSVEQVPIPLRGLKSEIFGYIEIPAMGIRLALYPGADEEHMAKGAAILGAASLPVGGRNTNSVIAGHRGYRGAPYFRDIEKLKPGDEIRITNPWETLCFYVDSAAVIAPDDSDAVKIQEGKDMVTLLTCHPYRSHGAYRYVVYCVRADEVQDGFAENISCESSQGDIQREQLLRESGVLLILGFSGAAALRKLRLKKKGEQKRKMEEG